MTNWITKDSDKNIYWPSDEMKARAWVNSDKIYEEAAADPVAFWEKQARENIDWFKEWDTAYEWKPPYYKWFLGGKLNACYNAVDRHVKNGKADKPAIIWVPEPTEEKARILTYSDLQSEVSKFANVLKKLGVKKGDRVGIYLPLVPEVQIAMLACARIGAVHSVVFSAFSSASLQTRLIDAEARVLITCDGYYRRGKVADLKGKADAGLEGTPVEHVVVVKRLDGSAPMKEGRDKWWHDLCENESEDCAPEQMDSEDLLFLLYTSGTTGKPKGVMHTTGGYLTQACMTSKWVFDLHDDDVFWCTADIGWITGHTYACYGPLSCGATMLIFEGAPDFPDKDRMWEICKKHGVTIFYTAPTAIRMFAAWGEEYVKKHDLSKLRLLGTVGEPIDDEAWTWYFDHIGGGRCPITDTWWQTETGGTLLMSLPGIGPFVPKVAGRSFPGVSYDVLDAEGNPVKEGEGGFLVLKSPFPPGLLRGVYKNPEKYEKTYWTEYGKEIYYTSDGARFYDKNLVRVTGRVDDVMKVAGHRLSTAEVENAINSDPRVSECAVVPKPHEIKGDVPLAFVVLKGAEPSDELKNELKQDVRKGIGPTATPEDIIFVEELPKTRSGKIMRRMMRSLVCGKPCGDVTTLQNPESIDKLKKLLG